MGWDKEETKDQPERLNIATLAMAEALRSANGSALAAAPVRGEERISVFWRVFGGTLLSIMALVLVTVYQQFTSTLTELRSSLTHLNEAQAELVRKDEFNSRMTSAWNTVKDLQVAAAAASAARDRITSLEQQLHSTDDERKDLNKHVQELRERLAALEGKHAATAAAPKHQ